MTYIYLFILIIMLLSRVYLFERSFYAVCLKYFISLNAVTYSTILEILNRVLFIFNKLWYLFDVYFNVTKWGHVKKTFAEEYHTRTQWRK